MVIESLYLDNNVIKQLSLKKSDKYFLELELVSSLCDELKEIFRKQFKKYFQMMKYTLEQENDMLESNILTYVINDIIATNEYSIRGIAKYTHLPEEVIYDLVIGINQNPSLAIARKIIRLHRSIKPDLYRELLQKIFSKAGLT